MVQAFADGKQNLISIPYGAIKSYPRAFWQNAKFFISIPYGAIKSFKSELLYRCNNPFQFLMVRLKVYLLLHLLIVH